MTLSVVYIVFLSAFESSTLKDPKNDTPLDYIAPYIQIVKMEVTLTSSSHTQLTSSVVYFVFQPRFESSTLKNPEKDTPIDYIAPYIQIVKMEVTLTSSSHTQVTSSVVYTVFQPGFESSTLKNPKNDTQIDYVAPDIQMVKMEVTLTSTFYT